MRKIYIGFSTSKRWNPLSALMKWWWGVPYSHVYLRWPTPWGFDEVLEASSGKVAMVEWNIWKKKNQSLSEVEWTLTKAEWDRVMRELRAKTGTPYGYWQVLSIAACELLKLDKNPWGDEDATWVCSELAYKFLLIIGIVTKLQDNDRVTPQDIWEMVHG